MALIGGASSIDAAVSAAAAAAVLAPAAVTGLGPAQFTACMPWLPAAPHGATTAPTSSAPLSRGMLSLASTSARARQGLLCHAAMALAASRALLASHTPPPPPPLPPTRTSPNTTESSAPPTVADAQPAAGPWQTTLPSTLSRLRTLSLRPLPSGLAALSWALLPRPRATGPAPGQRHYLHGMVSIMAAAEGARDVLAAVTHPVSYTELAAHLARDYSAELFDAVAGLVRATVDEMSGPELANLLWALATVGHVDPGVVSAVRGALCGRLGELGPQQLANALWAHVRLGQYDAQAASAAAECVWEVLPQCTPRQLVAVTQAYAWFRRQDPQLEDDRDLFRGVAARFRQQLPAASSAEIALMLAALAQLRRADERLLSEACAELAARTHAAGTAAGVPPAAVGVVAPPGLAELAEAVWACAVLQHQSEGLLEAVAGRTVAALQMAATAGPLGLTAAAAAAAVAPGMAVAGLGSLLPMRPSPDLRGMANAAAVARSSVPTEAEAGAKAVEALMAAAAGRPGGGGGGIDVTHGPSPGRARREVPTATGAAGARAAASAAAAVSARPPGTTRPAAAAMEPLLHASVLPPVQFSAVWPTPLGPAGHHNPSLLATSFNPALPDNWHPPNPAGSPASAAVSEAAARSSHPTSSPPPFPPSPAAAAAAAASLAAADSAALLDADVVSKLLWSYAALHAYSGPLYTLLFRQLPRLHHDATSWSALARLMGAASMALELQPGQGPCRINPLEAESAGAWVRLQRGRSPLHRLPEHLLPAAFVAMQAEEAGRDWRHALDMAGGSHCHQQQQGRGGAAGDWRGGPVRQGQAQGHVEEEQQAVVDALEPKPPGLVLSRRALEAEVSGALRALGLLLRPSASVDGLFAMEHTMCINGLTICLEVLSADCCTLDPPHSPLGHAAARLRSLEFRGWRPLVVPFHEWAALGPEEGTPALLAMHPRSDGSTGLPLGGQVQGPGGVAEGAGVVGTPEGRARRAAALEAAAAARRRYLVRKLEELIGEELPPLPQVPPKRRGV